MALKIGIASFVSAGYVNPVIWRLVETGTGVEVDSHQEMGPHGVVYNFDWTDNIRDIVYTVSLYEQPGGVGTGTLIKSHDVTPSTSTLVIDADIETIVDGGEPEDPLSTESTSPIITALIGKDFSVQKRGVGQLRAARDIEIINNGDGSYTLQNDVKFDTQDTYIIKIKPQYVVNPPGSIASPSIYKDVVLITTDYTVQPTDFGKLFIVVGLTPVVVVSLPLIANILSKLSIFVRNLSTLAHVEVVIKAQTGETILATGTTSNTFILGQGACGEVIKLASVLYGFTDNADIKRVGQMEWGYSVGLNRVIADGTEYLTADYPGLKKAMDLMQVGSVVTYSQWASSITDSNGDTSYPYKGFFALANDGLHFKVPDLSNKFVRALNGPGSDSERLTQGPGSLQIDSNRAHAHQTGTETDAGTGGVFRRLAAHAIRAWGGPSTTTFASSTADSEGVESRGKNVGLLPLIITG